MPPASYGCTEVTALRISPRQARSFRRGRHDHFSGAGVIKVSGMFRTRGRFVNRPRPDNRPGRPRVMGPAPVAESMMARPLPQCLSSRPARAMTIHGQGEAATYLAQARTAGPSERGISSTLTRHKSCRKSSPTQVNQGIRHRPAADVTLAIAGWRPKHPPTWRVIHGSRTLRLSGVLT
jgi:hypothetical protein